LLRGFQNHVNLIPYNPIPEAAYQRTGRTLFEGTVGPGTQQSYPLPVNVRVGNAGAVRAILNGRDLGIMGSPGQVVNRRFE
ncbi:MAG: DUF4115 domain-containing protein, partial [Deinococcus-Thermus bacterium]